MWQKVNTVPLQNLNVKSHMDSLGVDVKVKESSNRPGVAQKVPGGLGSQIS
jgi:hypothetical protein